MRRWLILFYVLVVTQSAHFVEHIAQMIQIHVLGLQGAAARGIVGALNIEWVHFTWNVIVLVAAVALLVRFKENPLAVVHRSLRGLARRRARLHPVDLPADRSGRHTWPALSGRCHPRRSASGTR
jgi:hypothetical protein